MQITIDLLSLALGFILGVCAVGSINTILYFEINGIRLLAKGGSAEVNINRKKGEKDE